jgi:hypothetical protein
MLKNKTYYYKGPKNSCKMSEWGPIMMDLLLWGPDCLEVEIYRHGYFVPGIKQHYHFVSFVKGVIPQEDFKGGSNTIRLHLAK